MEIVWNQKQSATRTRFSIGHEITHTFFPDCFEAVRYRECTTGTPGTKDAVERLCDVGAAELVMPTPEFTDELGALGLSIETMRVLRDRYQVCARRFRFAGSS